MNIFQRARKEGRVLLQDVRWQTYEAMLADPEVGHLRLTYHQGTLELCARLFDHERTRCVLRQILPWVMGETGLPVYGSGMTTVKREEMGCGLEPDVSYYILQRARTQPYRDVMPPHDRPPDLAVEVDIIGSHLDRTAIYASLGVPELWRTDGESIRVYRLRSGAAAYEWCERSPTFPFLPVEGVAGFLRRRTELCDSEVIELFRAWLRDEVLPDHAIHCS
jgi:Uma2 family endonuclease